MAMARGLLTVPSVPDATPLVPLWCLAGTRAALGRAAVSAMSADGRRTTDRQEDSSQDECEL